MGKERSISRWLHGWLLALLILGGWTVARAQFDTATVLGTVRDPSGAVVPNANVTLHNVELNTNLTRTTNRDGNYEFPGVQIGSYTVTVSAPGFESSSTPAFDLTVAARQRMDVPLSPGGAQQTVTVSADNLGLQTETSDRGTTIERRQIVDLPLNGREYTDLALLTPGVSVGALENGTVQQRRGSFTVNGNRSTANNFLLDGLDNNAYQISNQGYGNQSVPEQVDMVQEYRVSTSNYPAEFGRAGGAIVNVTTRSGTDSFHEVAFEYIRNTAFDAYGPFYGTGQEPTLIQNQFGGGFGGPIPKVKDFFFYVDYEGFRQITKTIESPTLPTADQRNGIFYNEGPPYTTTSVAIPLKNPYTLAAYSTGMVPQTAFTPFAAAVLAALPLPNVPGLETTVGATANYSYLGRGTNSRDIGDARLDKYFGNRLQTFLRFSKQSTHIAVAPVIPGPAGGSGDGHVRILTSSVAAGATYTLTSNSVLDARFGLVYTESGKLPYNYGVPNFYTPLNIPYPIDPSLGMAGLNTQTVRGFTAFGTGGTINQYTNPHTLNPKISYTLAKGKHSIGFGYEYLHLHEDVDITNPGYGADTYNGNFSSGTKDPVTSPARSEAYGLADFIQGARAKYELSNHPQLPEYYDFDYLYAEDSWKVFPTLTLNYGLRYEFSTPERATDNHISNFDPNTASLLLAGPGSIYNEALVHPKLDNFAPRIGFSYSFYPNIVFRGGYGISYVQFNRYGQTQDTGLNGPYSIDSVVTQSPLTQPVCPANSTSLTCFRTTMEGYPGVLITPATFSTLASQTTFQPKNNPVSYIQSYSFGTQVQLTRQTIFDLAYVGSHGVHDRVQTDYNQATPEPSPTATSSIQSRRPVTGFTDIIDNLQEGFNKYNSLQLQITQQATRGLFLINSLTFGKAFDNASASDEAANGDTKFVNFRNPHMDAGLSGYNQKLNESLGLNWNIPYGDHLGPLPLREALGGWTVTTITRLTTGLPINVTYDPAANTSVTDLGYGIRPNVNGPSYTVVNPRSKWVKTNTSYSNVFNTVQFSVPTPDVLFGNTPRNAYVGPNYYNVDFGLHKVFVLPEKVRFEFRAEAFNLLNHPNYKTPDTDLSDASFGSFTSSSSSLYPSRELQFAIRISR